MTEKAKKTLTRTLLKAGGIAASIGLPAWAILEKFPVWKAEQGTGKTIGIGAVMVLFVLLVTFRKTVWTFVQEKTGLKSAPPLMMWAVLFCVFLGLQSLIGILADLITICLAGIVGCAIGTGTTVVANILDGIQENAEGE